MSDKDQIDTLLAIAGNTPQLVAAQQIAAARLLAYDGEKYPSDGCAITLSVLMQQAGIDVKDTYGAFDLVALLKNKRGWTVVQVGQQLRGDVGTTCGIKPHHGVDHIYLVLQHMSDVEMTVADNQKPYPHFRYTDGQDGRSPSTYFLRAPASA